MKTDNMTQGRRLIEALKRRPFTYLEMNMLGVSQCAWKRVSESLYPNEFIIKTKGADGLIRWRVRRFG